MDKTLIKSKNETKHQHYVQEEVINMKVEELKSLKKNERTYSISFDENESVEIVGLLKNRINLIVRKD